MTTTMGRPRKMVTNQPAVSKRAHVNEGIKRHRRLGSVHDRESLPRICRYIAERARGKRVAVALTNDGSIHIAADGIDWLLLNASYTVAGVYHRPESWLDIYDDIRAQAGKRA